MRVFGGSRLTQLRKVRLIAALPAILNALQIAVPTALLGAVLGEYMGATDRSVGITLIRLQGALDSAGVWSVFLLCAVDRPDRLRRRRLARAARHPLDLGASVMTEAAA